MKSEPPSQTISLRARVKTSAVKELEHVSWEKFAAIFSKYHWHFPLVNTGEADEDDTQNNVIEFNGDGAFFQLATGPVLDDDPTQIYALIVDVADLKRAEVLRRLEGIAALGHTLYTHHPGLPVWRIIMPLAKPVSIATADAAYRQFFTDKMHGSMGYCDEEQGRWFLRPGCRDDLREFFDHFKIDGNSIDAEAVLAGAQNWDGTATTPTPPTSSASAASSVISTPLAHLTDEELRFDLEAIYASLKVPEDFVTVVDQILEQELELNRRQKWAPAYRPSFPIPQRTADLKPAHRVIQQTRVLIDCHWLHKQLHRRQATKEPKWQALLDPSAPFPLALAKEFAERAIAGTVRADEILCLTPFQQAQTRALIGQKMMAARKKAEDAKPTGHSPIAQLLKTINQWAAADRRLHADRYAALARAMFSLNDDKPTNTDLGKLVGLALGVAPIQENQIRAMKKRLESALSRFA